MSTISREDIRSLIFSQQGSDIRDPIFYPVINGGVEVPDENNFFGGILTRKIKQIFPTFLLFLILIGNINVY